MLAFFISLAVLALLTLVLFAVKLRIDMRIVLVVDQEQSLLDLELLPLGREKWRRQRRLELPAADLYAYLMKKLKQKRDYRVPGWFSNLSTQEKIVFTKKMLSVTQRFLRYVHIKELRWYSICGGEDAMETALRTGSLWAAKGIIIGVASSLCRLHHFHIKVEPDFAAQRLWSYWTGIFQVRLVHIMVIGAHICVWMIRGYLNGRTATRTTEQSSHRRVNENSYAEY
ncbi:MAG TPA: DUF2953 domain-containing protein [Syntrophomonadaceae bacterium]|nr:DUF2953 domain-containing protein [Syntrophomonadaceae bacterium]HPU48131.1 DUF2953 domain-containing protein [Syntrophomonadaceae bacterium]